MKLSTWLLVGGGIGAVMLYKRSHREPFAHELGPSSLPGRWADPREDGLPFVAPPDLLDRMQRAWKRNGMPQDRDSFVLAMQQALVMPPRCWGYWWDRTLGAGVGWPDEPAAERILNEAGNGWR